MDPMGKSVGFFPIFFALPKKKTRNETKLTEGL